MIPCCTSFCTFRIGQVRSGEQILGPLNSDAVMDRWSGKGEKKKYCTDAYFFFKLPNELSFFFNKVIVASDSP